MRRTHPTSIAATLCLLAALLATGGHWAVLQSIAWSRMLATYAQVLPLGTAVSRTFDGEHPCTLCLRIRAGRASEENQSPATPGQREPAPQPALTLAGEINAPPNPSGPDLDPTPFQPTPHCGPTQRPPVPPPRA